MNYHKGPLGRRNGITFSARVVVPSPPRSLKFFLTVLILLVPLHAAALPLSGGPHDLTAETAVSNICQECHIAHNSQEIALYIRDLTPDATEFSELCLDCHSGSPPPWSSRAPDVSDIDTSLHDFSVRPIGEGGVCWPCHELHLPDANTASYAGSDSGAYFTRYGLWKRDIGGELGEFYQKRDLGTASDPTGGPNYLVGMTVFCYDCHGGDARRNGPDDTDFSTAPQDIAFDGDRDVNGGNIGYYELPTGKSPTR